MTLTELLKPELIFPKIACSSKEDLIGKLLNHAYDAGGDFPLSREDLLKTIIIREKIGGTLLPSGLSIPHARIKDFEGFSFVLATPMEPLFHEGQQVRLAALMVSSQSGGPWYLAVLAALTRFSKDEGYFSRICGAGSTEELVSILRERDPELALA